MCDKRYFRRASPREVQPLHSEHPTPTGDAQHNRQAHQNDRKAQRSRGNHGQGVPQVWRSVLPCGFCLLGPRIVLPFLRRHSRPRFLQKNRMEHPAQQRQTQQKPPGGFPDFSARAHSGPQIALIWATPDLASSGVSEGLNSKTLRCSGFTTGLSAAKSIIPVPGGR